MKIKFGSGFLIANDLVLTCSHCVKDFPIQSSISMTDERSAAVAGSLLFIDYEVDLALIQLSNPYNGQKAIFTSRCLKRDKVRALGFNSSYENKSLDKIGNVQSVDNTHIAFNGDKIVDGYSGGPLINDENNCVMGIVSLSMNPAIPEGGVAIKHVVIDKFFRTAGIAIEYKLSDNHMVASALHKEMQKWLKEINVFFPRVIGNADIETSFEEFIRFLDSEDRKCSIIWGSGGLGKSILLKRIVSHFTESDPEGFHIYLDVKTWDSDRTEDIKKDSDLYLRVEQLFMGFECPFTAKQLELTGVRKYIYLDGMNEFADAELRKQVLDLLLLMSRQYNAIVISTSRLIDREVRGWMNYNVKKIEQSTLKKLLFEKFGQVDYSEKTLDYLSIPFFLDIVLRTGSTDIKSYSDFIYKHTLKNIPDWQKEEVMDELSRFTFDNYFTPMKFKFSAEAASHLPRELRIQEEILRLKDDHYEFEHHLIYEFFVANELAKQSDRWNKETYDVTSLDNKMSFELMQMTLEQIYSEKDGEKFLLSLYDWSFYATLHCLWYVDSKGKYPEQLAKALILILSEKLYDPFMHTRIQVMRHLERLYNKFTIVGLTSLFNKETILSLSNADAKSKYEEIIAANASSFTEPHYRKWYIFFSQHDGELKEHVLRHINNTNSIWGWSAANLARRYDYTDKNELQLRTMLHSITDNIIRWRIVHAMGICREVESVLMLRATLLSDSYKWVRYGTIRSLIEIALFNLPLQEVATLLHSIFYTFKTHTFDESIGDELRACLGTRMVAEKAKIVNQEMEEFRKEPFDSDTENKWKETHDQFRKYNP